MTGPHPMSHLASTRGFTLIEMMVALGIMALLAAFAVPKYEGYIDQARIARCIAEIRYLDRDIQAYIIANEKYPATLADLNLTIKNMLDPWGNPYEYVLLAGQTLVKNDPGDGLYYAAADWMLDIAPVYVSEAQSFWTGGWFVSEAWAAPMPQPQLTATPHTKGQRMRNLPQWSRHKGFIWSGPAVLGAPHRAAAGSGASSSAGSGASSSAGSGASSSAGSGSSSSAGGGSAVPTAAGGGGSSGGGGGSSGGGGGSSGGGGGSSGGGGKTVKPRKDRFLVPINSDYDLYSKGKDGESVAPLTAAKSRDDIVRAANGAFVGLAENF